MRSAIKMFGSFVLLAAVTGGLAGCAVAPKTEAGKDTLHIDAQAAVAKMQVADPGLKDFMTSAQGYAVFPSVGKGAFIVGASYGRGEVYEQGRFVGFADITKVTAGFQAGGQSYDELIVFQNKEALDNLKYGKLKFAADASAVAVKAGVAASMKYQNGVAIFVRPEGGLMFEASVGGQEFGFKPSDRDVVAPTSAAPAGPPPTTQPQ